MTNAGPPTKPISSERVLSHDYRDSCAGAQLSALHAPSLTHPGEKEGENNARPSSFGGGASLCGSITITREKDHVPLVTNVT